MDTDQTMRLIYLSLLAAAIGGSFLVSQRDNLGKTAQQAAIWALIFLGVIGAYGLWEDISRDATGRQIALNANTIEVPRSQDGHYYLTLDLNDVPVNFVVDTGASAVVLTQNDARRIGLKPDTLRYLGSANTANGVVRTANVTLDTVSMEDIRDYDVPAVVNEGAMEGSLLGMSYLGRFERLEITDGRLVLSR